MFGRSGRHKQTQILTAGKARDCTYPREMDKSGRQEAVHPAAEVPGLGDTGEKSGECAPDDTDTGRRAP